MQCKIARLYLGVVFLYTTIYSMFRIKKTKDLYINYHTTNCIIKKRKYNI